MTDGREAFISELERRGVTVTHDIETDRYRVVGPSGTAMVSIANLLRDIALDGDSMRVSRFVDAIELSIQSASRQIVQESLFWTLEPNDYVEKADFRFPVSDRVDRVLVSLSDDHRLITWISPEALRDAKISEEQAFESAFNNLDAALLESKLDFSAIGDVRLGYISAPIPMKSSLILAPRFRHFVSDTIGWPVLAVAPDRDFLYIWAARHKDFAGRVGTTVVKEFTNAAYPISTEVYSITDGGIAAIGEFPKSP